MFVNINLLMKNNKEAYQSNALETIGKFSLKIFLQLKAICLCSSWVPLADLNFI